MPQIHIKFLHKKAAIKAAFFSYNANILILGLIGGEYYFDYSAAKQYCQSCNKRL